MFPPYHLLYGCSGAAQSWAATGCSHSQGSCGDEAADDTHAGTEAARLQIHLSATKYNFTYSTHITISKKYNDDVYRHTYKVRRILFYSCIENAITSSLSDATHNTVVYCRGMKIRLCARRGIFFEYEVHIQMFDKLVFFLHKSTIIRWYNHNFLIPY